MAILQRGYPVSVTPTITAGAYTGGDVCGGLMAFDTLATGGDIVQLNIHDRDNEKAAGRFWLFSDRPGAVADNDPFAVADADNNKIIGYIDVAAADYVSIGSTSAFASIPVTATSANKALSYAVRTLYAYFVPSATPTYNAVNDLTFDLVVWPNN